MKKVLLVIVAVAFVIYLFYEIGTSFAPGSYPFAEEYEFSVSESKLISIIEKFKDENSQFKVPDQAQLLDHRNNYWYVIYFYDSNENKIIYTWTRPSGKDKTTFALVSVNEGLELGKWKRINKDFSSSENKTQITRFENLILKKVKEKTGR